MNEILATVSLTGAFLFLGGVLFRRLIWNVVSHASGETLNLLVTRRSAWLMISGATIFLLVASIEILLSRREAELVNILPAALAPLIVTSFLAGEARKSPILTNLAAVLGLTILGLLSATSHAGTEPGLLPVASNFIHWIATASWGGCLLYLSLLPWPAIYNEFGKRSARRIVRRYANVAIVALGLFLLSGGLLTFVHVHNGDAMITTGYGRFVILKGAIIAVLLLTVSFNVLKLARSKDTVEPRLLLRRFRSLLSIETILLAGLLVATGNLEARSPPGVPPFNNPQSWQMIADEVPLTLSLQPVGGSSTQARVEISATSPDYQFDEGTLAFFDFYMSEHDAGNHDIEAVWIGTSGFLGESVLAVPGEWKFVLRLLYPDGTTFGGESEILLPALPLQEDLKPFLSFSAIVYSLPGLITFVVGVLLLLSAGWLLRESWLGKTPGWLLPVNMANMILGGYLALSVTFVKTYPTTFWNNPEPYDVEIIQKGDAVYREHCAECHGIAGKGDGPWAIEERGSIPDLTAPHMDVHTDGEVFWWLTKGIPSLDKPPMNEELSESQRWIAINYIRSLRHGMPAQ